jgi:hypothetical protein
MKILNPLLLAEYRIPGNCDFCGKLCRAREPAHVIAKGMGAGRQLDIPLNLLAAGSSRTFECDCHRRQHDSGQPGRLEMLQIAADREFGQGFVHAECVQDLLWEILRTPKTREPEDCKHDEQRCMWRVGQSWYVCSLCGKSIYWK